MTDTENSSGYLINREINILYYENKFKEEFRMMGSTKKVLNWTDKKFEEIVDNPDEKHPNLKAFGLGAIEGVIDGAVIAYPILLVGCFVAAKKLKKLKE